MLIAQSVLDDLRRRLADVRWPAGVTDSGGVPLDDAKEFIRYWRDEFDWRAYEQRIEAFHHDKRNGIHFIHEKSGRPPLVLLHGWPGSFIEFLHVIPRITDSFDVIVPSLPGYGFSDPPFTLGTSNRQIAAQICDLMTSLGYDRFAVQGGDWGAGVSTWIARDHPERLTAMHLNYIPGSYAPHADDMTEAEQQFLRDAERWVAASYAYGHEDAPAHPRLRPRRLARRPRHLDLGEVPRVGRPALQPRPRRHPRQHHALLGDEHHHIVDAPLPRVGQHAAPLRKR